MLLSDCPTLRCVQDVLRPAGLRRRRASSVVVGAGDGRRVTSTYWFCLVRGVGASYGEADGLRHLTKWWMRVQVLNSQSRSLRGEM